VSRGARLGPPVEAVVTVGRVQGGEDGDHRIWLRVQVGRFHVAELEMTPEAFSLALTGMSEVPARYRGRFKDAPSGEKGDQ